MGQNDNKAAPLSLEAPESQPKTEDVVEKPPASRLRRAVGFALFNLIAVLVLLLLAEGVASVFYAFRAAFATAPVAESLYTEYDRDLGWVNLPNVYLPNMYGPGKFLRTNGQRFRNDHDFTKTVPAGKARIICSGDSFTLGFGVDNEHTWPAGLATRAANLETVNMGQGGYGADQAYLWYKRDGSVLDHDIQIFAIISPDIFRMQHASFNGYGKPVLTVDNDRVVATNVPVPRTMEVWSPRLVRTENALSNLSLTRALKSVFRFKAAAPLTDSKERNQETAWVMTTLLDELAAMNRAKGSVLVLAYLPTREELTGETAASWRTFLADYAREHHALYFDLFDDFRALPPTQRDSLFITRAAVEFPGAAGHYTEAGNEFVAGLIYQRLMENAETAAKVGSSSAR